MSSEYYRQAQRDTQVIAARVNLALIDLRAKLADVLHTDYPGVLPTEEQVESFEDASLVFEATTAELSNAVELLIGNLRDHFIPPTVAEGDRTSSDGQ